jgi:phospholipase/carboxylesterase
VSGVNDPHAGQPVAHAGAPLGEGRAVVIMVHGRNAGPANILGLAAEFKQPDVTWLAPAAANGTWYPYGFMADRATNEPFLTSALNRLRTLVADVTGRGVPASKIVLLGFSQGACLTGEFAVRHATRYGGIVMFSGGLIGPPGTTWENGGSLDQTPVFLGCSDLDSHIPKSRVDESAVVFGRLGADVTKRIYPGMGHLVNADEIGVASSLIAKIPV